MLIPVIPLPEKSQNYYAVQDLRLICSSDSGDLDGVIACQVCNGALSKSTH